MKANMKFTVAIAMAALLTAGFVSTAQADGVGLAIYEQILPDGTPTAWAVWTSDPGATIVVSLLNSGPDGRLWVIDLTDSGHQVDGSQWVYTWNDINSPGRWNNLYWSDQRHLYLESEWLYPTGDNMAWTPNGFDNGVSIYYGSDFNGDDVYASVTKLPVSCAAGFSNAYEMQNWSSSGIAEGTTAITPSSGPAGSAIFSYDVNLGIPGFGVGYRTASFQTVADGTQVFSFDYDYTGLHAWFLASSTLQVFADGPDGRQVITLFDGETSGYFQIRGWVSIQTYDGYAFGFIVGGGNFDSNSILQGNLTISNVNGDADNDTVTDVCDRCPGFDDRADWDGDGVPDDCDRCPGSDDRADWDGDGVPDDCDMCPGHDDKADIDFDHIADGCDKCSLVGDINCDGAVNLQDFALMAGNWLAYN